MKMYSLEDQTKQMKQVALTMVDETAAEIAMSVIRSKKSRTKMYDRMMEYAGTNRAEGAEELRVVAQQVKDGIEIFIR